MEGSASRPLSPRGPNRGMSRTSTSNSASVRSVTSVRVARSPSPSHQVRASELDQRSIIALSQACTEDLDVKSREKTALTKLLSELKKSKLQLDSKIMKKKKDVDSAIVQIMELEKKLSMTSNNNRMMSQELTGLRSENERVGHDVDQLRHDLHDAKGSFQRELDEIERKKETLHTYRKEINAETKQRDNVQQDLRASRAAQNLMINRLDDMGRRNRALKNCVVNTISA